MADEFDLSGLRSALKLKDKKEEEKDEYDIEGLKKALATSAVSEEIVSGHQKKLSEKERKRQELLQGAEATRQALMKIPGFETAEGLVMGAGKAISKTGAALTQLAGKGVSLVAPETGEQIYQQGVKSAQKAQEVMAPIEKQSPIATGVGEVSGYIFNPINRLIPGFGGPATTMTGAIAKGAGQGAIANVLTTPVTDENEAFLTAKAKQAVVGGAAGGVVGGAIKGITGIAEPVKNVLSDEGKKAVDFLRSRGIPIDVAQATGSQWLTRAKGALADNPFTAGKEAEFAAMQQTAFNKAVAKTMGEDAQAITADVLQNAKNRLGQNYDDLFNKYGVKVSGDTYKALKSVREDAQKLLPESDYLAIKNTVDEIIDKASQNRSVLDGKTYQYFKRNLDRLTESNRNNAPFANDLKEVLLNGLKKSVTDESDVALLKLTNKEYGNMKKIEDVVLKNPEGNISPSLLSNSLATKSKRYAIYAQDNELARLARSGKLILEQKLPNSGTMARMLAQRPLFAYTTGLYQSAVQKAIRNPQYAKYLEEGMQPGMARNIAQIPTVVGGAIPPYAAKPGVAGATLLREFVTQRNLENQ